MCCKFHICFYSLCEYVEDFISPLTICCYQTRSSTEDVLLCHFQLFKQCKISYSSNMQSPVVTTVQQCWITLTVKFPDIKRKKEVLRFLCQSATHSPENLTTKTWCCWQVRNTLLLIRKAGVYDFNMKKKTFSEISNSIHLNIYNKKRLNLIRIAHAPSSLPPHYKLSPLTLLVWRWNPTCVCVCVCGQWIIGFCAGMTVWELSKRRRREEREGEKRKNFRGEEKPQDTHGAISSLSLFLLSFPLSHTHICTHSQSVPADHLQRSYDWKRGRVILY